MNEREAKSESSANWLTLALTLLVPVGYSLLWSQLGGADGCGPPAHSATGRIFLAAPVALPVAAAGMLLAFGAKRRWRGATLAWAATTILLLSGAFEVFVFLLQFGAHHCGE